MYHPLPSFILPLKWRQENSYHLRNGSNVFTTALSWGGEFSKIQDVFSPFNQSYSVCSTSVILILPQHLCPWDVLRKDIMLWDILLWLYTNTLCTQALSQCWKNNSGIKCIYIYLIFFSTISLLINIIIKRAKLNQNGCIFHKIFDISKGV
jgi:hypothetical protein